jgi:hypothetical protein
MSFTPPRTTGLALGLGTLGVLVLLDAICLITLRRGPMTWAGFAAFVCLLASLPAGAYIGLRTYELARARYTLSRDALGVTWGGWRVVLPLTQIAEARTAAGVEGRLWPRGLNWPGNLLGRGTAEGLGAVDFAASTGKPGLVLLRHAEGWLALSPGDPQAFLAALTAAQEEGPEQAVAYEAEVPRYLHWELWQDRLALGLLGAGLTSVVLLLGYLALISPQLPPEIALHFNAAGTPDRFGPPAGLLILPLIAGLSWLVNGAIGVWLHASGRQRPATYLLLSASLFVQALVWVATVGLLTAGNAA